MTDYYSIEHLPNKTGWIRIVKDGKVLQVLIITEYLNLPLAKYVPPSAHIIISRDLLRWIPNNVLNLGLSLDKRAIVTTSDTSVIYAPVEDVGSVNYRLCLEEQKPNPDVRRIGVYYDTITHQTYYA